jgi:hypothetical protein
MFIIYLLYVVHLLYYYIKMLLVGKMNVVVVFIHSGGVSILSGCAFFSGGCAFFTSGCAKRTQTSSTSTHNEKQAELSRVSFYNDLL